MSSIAEDLIAEVLARLVAVPVIAETDRIRRDHLTPVTRDLAPSVNVVTGDDIPDAGKNACTVARTLYFAVEVDVRADATYAAADPIMVAIMAALDPDAESYPHSALLKPGRIRRPRPTIADLDALRVVMEFEFSYRSQLWTLDQGN